MPGFVINGKGEPGPPNTIDLLYNHRWMITQLGPISQNDTLVARDLGLPDLKFDKQEILAGLIWYKYAKSVRWDDASVTFYDNGDIGKKIQEWQDSVFTVADGIKQHHPSGGYKKDSIFSLLDGEGTERQKFTLKNSWPISISPGKLSYTDTNIKLLVVTLSFDWAEFETTNESQSHG